ncbi:Rz1-like lysis system protein LysC [Gilliamella sp. B2717]|uniref:Rz1-like lysis system protein LysC n=1 Tax=Gilliamella sp. B2717 TaxID=2817996 RepID=UPI003A5CEA06
MIICLIQLSGCTNAPPSREVRIIKIGCPTVTQCYLPANNLKQNRSLIDDNQLILTAWFECALQVDAIYQCQQEQHEKDKAVTRNTGK